VITEIMNNPSTATDQNGEWFELYNAGTAIIDLAGVVVRDDGADAHTIGVSVLVAPGARVVLARSADTAVNGGLTPGTPTARR